MPDQDQHQHECRIFATPEDRETMSEFIRLLRNGGCEKLRDAMQMGADYKTVREAGLKQLIKAIMNVIGWAIILGLGVLIAKLGIATAQSANIR
jgi:hypothetical protein